MDEAKALEKALQEPGMNDENVELPLVTRLGWEAKPAVIEIPALVHPVKNVVMAYNTAVDACFTEDDCKVRMRELQQLHIGKGMPDLHYNFLIGSDGNLYEGRGWHLQPDFFTEKMELDEKSLCIGVIGDGKDMTNGINTALITAVYLANHGVDKGYIEKEYTICEDTQTF